VVVSLRGAYKPSNQREDAAGRDTASAGFSAAGRAGKPKQVGANGVLDEPTLFAMIKEWQSRRLKDRTPTQPDQLLNCAPSDFTILLAR